MSLLASIAILTGHNVISDLRPEYTSAHDREQMARILNSFPHDGYPESEWEDALKYLGIKKI